MRVYLSYKFGDDVTTIKNLLHENSIEIFDSITDIQYSGSIQQSIKNSVKSCDFLVFIYSGDNPNIAFEAGIAVASNKPIFSILSGGNEDTFLRDSTCVHGLPNEVEKIKFSLELFLKQLEIKKSSRAISVSTKSHRYYGGGEAVPNKRIFDIAERYQSIKNKSGISLEHFFEEIFHAYLVNTAKRPEIETENWLPDFSIWSDELSTILSNPVIVEVKKEINISNLKTLLANLDKIKNSNPANSAIVFYDQLGGVSKKDLPTTPTRLFIAIPDLIEQMQSNGFASAIKKIRNELVHNF